MMNNEATKEITGTDVFGNTVSVGSVIAYPVATQEGDAYLETARVVDLWEILNANSSNSTYVVAGYVGLDSTSTKPESWVAVDDLVVKTS